MSKVKELGNIIKKLHDGVDKELVKKNSKKNLGLLLLQKLLLWNNN